MQGTSIVDELVEFWFEEQWGQVMLVMKPHLGTRIIILLGSEDRSRVRELLVEHIPFREQPEKHGSITQLPGFPKKYPSRSLNPSLILSSVVK